MVVFATTRLEFGRDDKNIGWRMREMKKWNSFGKLKSTCPSNSDVHDGHRTSCACFVCLCPLGELQSRQKEWIEFIIRHHQSGKLALTANNVYDAEYVRYFTGILPHYIPSWCGDVDGSYGGKQVQMLAWLHIWVVGIVYLLILLQPFPHEFLFSCCLLL
jgi:hypothetical protein